MSTQATSEGLAGLLDAANPAGQDPLAAAIAETVRQQKETADWKRKYEEAAAVTYGKNGIEIHTLEGLWRVGKMYSSSNMVPDQFRGKPQDCAIAAQLAQRLGCDLFMLMQHMFVVHGRPGLDAQMHIALANKSGRFKGPIKYKLSGSGMSRQCTAMAIDAENGELCEMTVSMQTAQAEGWLEDKPKRTGGVIVSKWKTIPELMLRYRSAAWLIRTHCPDVVMGMSTTEELQDIREEMDTRRGADVLQQMLDAGDTGTLSDLPGDDPEAPNPQPADKPEQQADEPPFNPPTPDEAEADLSTAVSNATTMSALAEMENNLDSYEIGDDAKGRLRSQIEGKRVELRTKRQSGTRQKEIT